MLSDKQGRLTSQLLLHSWYSKPLHFGSAVQYCLHLSIDAGRISTISIPEPPLASRQHPDSGFPLVSTEKDATCATGALGSVFGVSSSGSGFGATGLLATSAVIAFVAPPFAQKPAEESITALPAKPTPTERCQCAQYQNNSAQETLVSRHLRLLLLL